MIFAPVPLSLKAGYVLASLLSCDPGQTPSVILDFKNDPPGVSRKSTEELDVLRAQSSSPEHRGEFQHVQGVKDGTFQLAYSLNFTHTSWPLLGKACVQPSSLNITLTYTPFIYINNLIPDGSCEYNVTFEHEMRHVEVDVATLKEFIPSIKKIAAATLALHNSRAPIDKDDVERKQKTISDALSKVLDGASERLQESRTLRQQAVDSREEYTRLSKACPFENNR